MSSTFDNFLSTTTTKNNDKDFREGKLNIAKDIIYLFLFLSKCKHKCCVGLVMDLMEWFSIIYLLHLIIYNMSLHPIETETSKNIYQKTDCDKTVIKVLQTFQCFLLHFSFGFFCVVCYFLVIFICLWVVCQFFTSMKKMPCNKNTKYKNLYCKFLFAVGTLGLWRRLF